MNILILHGLDSIESARRTSLHHAFFLPRHAPNHTYWLHAASAPVTDGLKSTHFDVIIIDTTFLCWRWARQPEIYFEPLKRKYEFVKNSGAVKIAFPQDEYDHSEILERWLSDWKVDVIYSVCFEDRETFYPDLSRRCKIRPGYTGLFEPIDLALVQKAALPWRTRGIDVGYRAKRLPPYFGSFGMLKADIADSFLKATRGTALDLDISCEPSKAIYGDGWLHFLGNCKFVLGCESGSSLLDPIGEFRARTEAYLEQNPNASFSEVEGACFPGLDREKPFKAISPRLFEAAAAGCGQILVIGEYEGALHPWEHYLPLAPDASNISEIITAIEKTDEMEAMIERSQSALLQNPRFSYEAYAADVLQAVEENESNLPEATQDPTDSLLKLALMTGERWATEYSKLAAQNVAPSTHAKKSNRLWSIIRRAGNKIRGLTLT